jgi:hypothetical protein
MKAMFKKVNGRIEEEEGKREGQRKRLLNYNHPAH